MSKTMKNAINCKAIMLSQNKKGWDKNDIILHENGSLSIGEYSFKDQPLFRTAQHIYITSDEEIKEYDQDGNLIYWKNQDVLLDKRTQVLTYEYI